MSTPMDVDKVPKVALEDLDVRDIVGVAGVEPDDVQLLTAMKQHAYYGNYGPKVGAAPRMACRRQWRPF